MTYFLMLFFPLSRQYRKKLSERLTKFVKKEIENQLLYNFCFYDGWLAGMSIYFVSENGTYSRSNDLWYILGVCSTYVDGKFWSSQICEKLQMSKTYFFCYYKIFNNVVATNGNNFDAKQSRGRRAECPYIGCIKNGLISVGKN